MTPDINVLLAAFRVDHVHHEVALDCLRAGLASARTGQSLVRLPMVVAGFLRLATHGRIFVEPAPAEAAVAFIDSLLAAPGVEFAELGREWPVFRRLVSELGLGGNDVPDAWIAAAVQQHGERLVTFDRGFGRLLGRAEVTVLQAT
jgi:toxin-antitoxin system PIN domain toxin